MENHNVEFFKSNTFDNIVNLYQLPTTILTFTDCRKKVKAHHLELNVTTLTFEDQEGGVQENGDSKTTDFRPEVKLKWDHDNEGLTIFPPNFDFEFVVVDKETEGDEVEVADNKGEHEVN
ncbi:hypothetical protein SLEP1_g17459 [Rubroshorea leprosula]|uniref:Uncharacterized protein n=1 Tax=Rubroshorea leprosula TaxID=152421 RepID=A0AAV5IUD4_9ROSI|nr:hypothetical protein SLEP1_g17459 [Rubroshorea leprosula]